jgi:uncharacterized protein with HEPN domain
MPREPIDPRHKDRTRLLHMLDSARRAVAFVGPRAREDLSLDDVSTLGLIKSIEVVGEAASQVSDPTRARFPEVPWTSIVAMRHRMVHGYDSIDLDIVWNTATKALPALVRQLESAIERF